MTKFFWTGVILLTAFFVLMPIAAKAAEDKTPPQLIEFNISPTQIDTSEEDQEITITVRVTDDLSGLCYNAQIQENCQGVGQMEIRLLPLIGTQTRSAWTDWTLVSGDILDGVYENVVTIPKWSKSGVWQVEWVALNDALGNIRTVYTEEPVPGRSIELGDLFPDSNLTFTNTQSDTLVTIEKEWTLSSSSNDTTVVFPENTLVTRNDGGSFQFYKMVNQHYTVSDLPETESMTSTPVAAIRFGIPGLNLTFDKDVSVTMRVPASYANQTLKIQSLEEGENEWANESECEVSYVGDKLHLMIPDEQDPELEVMATDQNGEYIYIPDPEDTDAYGVCNFTVNHASYFTASAAPYIVTGTKSGAGPVVKVFTSSGRLVNGFLAYSEAFEGGINVAVGDINGDGTNEIITSPRTGGGPQIRVFDINGNNLGWDFMAYDVSFRGGVNIAVGDIEGDGPNEIITAPMSGGGPNIRIFGLRGDAIIPTTENFMAYASNFRGGIAVSIGDIEGDGVGDIVTTPTSLGGPHVRVFGARNHRFVPVTLGVMAYANSFRGGINSCLGDVDGDGWDEIITGIVSNGGPHVRILGVPGLRQGLSLESPGFMAYNPASRGGVDITSIDINGDGVDEIITGVGGDGDPLVRIFNSEGEQALPEFNAYSTSYKGGITLASGFFSL
ncbi:MAG: VCBS repeat-containing protein [Patescibacteria group bacterium]|jgi:hypothetical protein